MYPIHIGRGENTILSVNFKKCLAALQSSGENLLNGVNTSQKRNFFLRSIFYQSVCMSFKHLSKIELLVQHLL